MAGTNVIAPKGFVPVCDAHGRTYKGKGDRYYKGTAANTRICIGDRVVAVASTDANGFPEIVRAAAGAACTGVVVGMEIVPSNLHKLCYEAADTGYLMVETDPNILYRIQDDGAGGGLTVTAIDQMIDPITSLDGDAATGLSKLTLSCATAGTGTTCRIKQLDQSPDNFLAANANWLVQMNLSTEVNASAANLTAHA